MTSTIKKPLKYILSVAFWVAVWWVAAEIANRSLLFPVPTPATVAVSLYNGIFSASFWGSALLSVARILLGFLAAVVFGVIIAFLCTKYSAFETVISPIKHLIKAIPVASFIFLVFLWMDKSLIPSFTAFLIVFPVVETNVSNGIKSADRELYEMAYVFKLKKSKIYKEILLPAVLPYFNSAIITGIGFAWKSGVAAEVIVRPNTGLGNILWGAKSAIDYNEVFAVTLVIVLLSALLERLIKSAVKGATK